MMLNPRGMPDTEFVVGVDLGQKQDYTAVSVVERSNLYTGEVCGATYEKKREVTYWLRYLERVKLGTSYPDIVERVRELVTDPNIAGRCTLVVDATGVGGPVVDLLKRAGLGVQADSGDDYGRRPGERERRVMEGAEAGVSGGSAGDVRGADAADCG